MKTKHLEAMNPRKRAALRYVRWYVARKLQTVVAMWDRERFGDHTVATFSDAAILEVLPRCI